MINTFTATPPLLATSEETLNLNFELDTLISVSNENVDIT